MQLAMVAAGFSWRGLTNCVGRWRRGSAGAVLKDKLTAGCWRNGYTPVCRVDLQADRVSDAESHAANFALLVYASLAQSSPGSVLRRLAEQSTDGLLLAVAVDSGRPAQRGDRTTD